MDGTLTILRLLTSMTGCAVTYDQTYIECMDELTVWQGVNQRFSQRMCTDIAQQKMKEQIEKEKKDE
jgi:hypothetical protein